MIDKIDKNLINSFLENKFFLNKTDLCHLMSKYGSDKGSNHNYTTFYSFIFDDIKSECLQIFEVGLGTNNINISSNMGPGGRPGASLRGWKEFFYKSDIFGADVDDGILFEEDRISTFYVDQTSEETIFNLWSNENLESIEFDIIIDDGPHTLESLIFFSENYFKLLKPKGYFILEDIINPEWSSLLLKKLPKNVEYKKIINMQGLQKTKKLHERWKNGLDVIICKNI